jgi:hypothetical protein
MSPRPRKSKSKKEGFQADERLNGVKPLSSTENRVIQKPEALAEVPVKTGCPRREMCVNADADPSYCLVVTEPCGGFRRIGAPERKPAGPPVTVMHGTAGELDVYRMSPIDIADELYQARLSREAETREPFRLDPRSQGGYRR